MRRRKFLLVCTAAATGLWMQSVGLTTLTRKVVVALSGDCSFCGHHVTDVGSMARSVGAQVRICDHCVSLCMDVLAESGFTPEDLGVERAATAATCRDAQDRIDTEAFLGDLLKIRQATESGAYESEIDRMIASARAFLERSPGARSTRESTATRKALSCTFCEAKHAEVKKLLAGPTVYICDGCIGEAAVATQAFGSSQLERA
jgi:hypothetical protein